MTNWYIDYTFQRLTGNREIVKSYACIKCENIHDAISTIEKQQGEYLVSIDQVIRRGART